MVSGKHLIRVCDRFRYRNCTNLPIESGSGGDVSKPGLGGVQTAQQSWTSPSHGPQFFLIPTILLPSKKKINTPSHFLSSCFSLLGLLELGHLAFGVRWGFLMYAIVIFTFGCTAYV